MKTKLSLQEALDSTKRIQYVDKDVLKNAPKETSEGKLEFFNLGKVVSDSELAKEYETRDLVPANIHNIVEYDLANPDKMDEMKHVCTSWKDENNNWCYAAFNRWYGKRGVNVNRNDSVWRGFWWFAGVSQVSLSTKSPSTSSDTFPLELESALKIVKEAGYKIYKEI